MKIEVNDTIWLDEFSYKDMENLTRYLNDRAIYDATLHIPHPYTLSDARDWIDHTKQEARDLPVPRNFAIRKSGELIGGVGYLKNVASPYSHLAEVDYWLAKEYWGKGYMTEIVRCFTKWVFTNLPVEKLTANVFSGNIASANVLTKNNFKEEGLLHHHIKKDGKFFDCRVFGLLKEEYK